MSSALPIIVRANSPKEAPSRGGTITPNDL